MCLKGEILGERFRMIVDTGSSITMMKKSVWETLGGEESDLRPPRFRIVMVNGTEMTSYGVTELALRIEGMKMKMTFEITDCEDEVVVGLDFVRRHVEMIDLEGLYVRIRGKKVAMDLYDPPEASVRIVAVRDVIIPAATEKMIEGTGRIQPGQEGLLEMEEDPDLDRKWLTARALVRCRGAS